MVCRTADAAHAGELGGAGQIDEATPHPAAHPFGTTIEVRDLFFNTPARRKFLKSEATEFRQVQQAVSRVALSRFDVGFVLPHTRRSIFDLAPAGGDEGRLAPLRPIFGGAFFAQSVANDAC